MNIVQIRRIRDGAKLPRRASNFAVGFDVYASRVLNKRTKKVKATLPVTIQPEGSVLIGIGVQFAMPFPWQCEVKPRSGLANKHDIELSNSPGTIDPDFRGEAGVLLRNRSKKNPFIIKEGMRIAQLVFTLVKIPIFEEVPKLPESIRADGGFGSTGLFGITEGTDEYKKAILQKHRSFMAVVNSLARISTDKTACVVVNSVERIISTSHGCAEKMPVETMALSNLLFTGTGLSTRGATMYLNTAPDARSFNLVIASGVNQIVLPKKTVKGPMKVFLEARITVRYV